MIFLAFIEKTKSGYAYPVVFFAAFPFFSIVIGKFSQQAEARLAAMPDIVKYPVAIIVILILFLIVWKSSHIKAKS